MTDLREVIARVEGLMDKDWEDPSLGDDWVPYDIADGHADDTYWRGRRDGIEEGLQFAVAMLRKIREEGD